MKFRVFALGIALASVISCGSGEPAPSVASGNLPAGVVARVANADVHVATVVDIARIAKVSRAEARDRAIADALFAQEAGAHLSDAERSTITRAALGRALLESLLRDAAKLGPVTDEEVERLTSERWVDLDRPASARVTHAVALYPKSGDPTTAHRVAEAIAEAVQGIADPNAFIAAAKAVPAEGVDVRAERLPAMTPDGRGFSLEGLGPRDAGTFDPVFAKAANALTVPGEQSKVIETRFGFHVLLLETKLPEIRLSLDERRRLLEKEVLARRAGVARQSLVDALSQQIRVEVARDFDARTAGLGGS